MDIALRKTLADRIYDKRKYGAMELEQNVRDYLSRDQPERVQAVIDELTKDYAYAVTHPNHRNGGLIGLAAVAVALGQQELAGYLDSVVPPILACFGDADSRVRYYACESLYNVAKVAKGEILQYFNEIFDVLCKLVSDPEEGVRTAADLVDRLIKDIVAEKAATYTFIINRDAPQVPARILEAEDGATPALQVSPPQVPNNFRLANFIPVLVERLYVISPNTRMFLVQWIVLLDSIPDLELVSFLPEFLNSLLLFLSDSTKEVRVATKATLDGLLKDLRTIAKTKKAPATLAPDSSPDASLAAGLYIVGQDTYINFEQITNIIISALDSPHEEIKFVALQWINAFLEISPQDINGNLSRLVAVLLPTLSDTNQEIRDSGSEVSERILMYVSSASSKELEVMPIADTCSALTTQFLGQEEVTRIACLDWLMTLHKISGQEPTSGSTTSLFKLLSDPSDQVVTKVTQLIGQLLQTASDEQLTAYTKRLVAQFKGDRKLLASRGRLVLLKLCQLIDAETVYRTLAIILREEEDNEFCALMVQNAMSTLMLGPELAGLRQTLRSLHTSSGSSLFISLFKTWCQDGISALSLCLLAQAYEHAFAVLRIIASTEISVPQLVQIDRLVQLIESPLFSQMRMQLLEPQQYPYLYKCLYGLLMVLPQSSAFTTLNTRLQSISGVGSIPVPQKQNWANQVRTSNIDWNELLELFRKTYLNKK